MGGTGENGFGLIGIEAVNGFAVSGGAAIGLSTTSDMDAVNGLGSGDGFDCDAKPYVSVSTCGAGMVAAGTVKGSLHVGHDFVLPADFFFACKVFWQ